MFFRALRGGGWQRRRRCCVAKGYSLSEENTPFRSPRERRGESPSTPALRDLGLKDCPACGIRCLPSDVSKRFGLLLLPAAALPAIRQPSAISVYFGFYRPCKCLPRRHCFARRVCLRHRQKVVELRSLRYALPKMPAPSTEGNSSAPTQDQQSGTCKGCAASVRQQSCQRLRNSG